MNTSILTHTGITFDINNPTVAMIDEIDIAHALSLTNRFTGHTKHPWSVAQHSLLALWAAHSHAVFRERREGYTIPNGWLDLDDYNTPLLTKRITAKRRMQRVFFRAVLLHDAHEAYVGDVSTPFGRMLCGWDDVRTRLATMAPTLFAGITQEQDGLLEALLPGLKKIKTKVQDVIDSALNPEWLALRDMVATNDGRTFAQCLKEIDQACLVHERSHLLPSHTISFGEPLDFVIGCGDVRETPFKQVKAEFLAHLERSRDKKSDEPPQVVAA